MDRLLLLSHPPRATCELQGNDSPGFGMRKCRGFTHPVLLLISSSADCCCSCSIVTRHYKSSSRLPVLVSPVSSAHVSSFPSRSLLLTFYSLSFGVSLSDSSQCGSARASCGLLCQNRARAPEMGLQAQEHVGLRGACQALGLQPGIFPRCFGMEGWMLELGLWRSPGLRELPHRPGCRALLVPLLGAPQAAYQDFILREILV